jgi:hypothetical protein
MSTLSVLRGGPGHLTIGTNAWLPRCANSRSPTPPKPNPFVVLGRSSRAQSRMAAPLLFCARFRPTEWPNRFIALVISAHFKH